MKTSFVKKWSGRITGGGPSMGGNIWVLMSKNIPLIWMHLKPSVELLPVEKDVKLWPLTSYKSIGICYYLGARVQ